MFKLSRPSSGKSGTIKDELMAIAKMTGEIPPELDYPEPPLELRHLIPHYNNLSSSDLSYCEIKAYMELSETKLLPYEIQAIKDIDSTRSLIMSGTSIEKILEAY